MATHLRNEPGYWDRFPPDLEGMAEVAKAQGIRLSMHVLGDQGDETAPTALMLRMPPGYVLPKHAHPCNRLEVVVEGAMRVGDLTLGPGDVLSSNHSQAYGPHIAGPDGCTTVEIFSTRAGAHALMVESPDGLQTIDLAAAQAVAETNTL
jgi:anti-sigma factor ChrR (cupin superfamily)